MRSRVSMKYYWADWSDFRRFFDWPLRWFVKLEVVKELDILSDHVKHLHSRCNSLETTHSYESGEIEHLTAQVENLSVALDGLRRRLDAHIQATVSGNLLEAQEDSDEG